MKNVEHIERNLAHAKDFGKAVARMMKTQDVTKIYPCRSEVSLYIMHMHSLVRVMFQDKRFGQFLEMVFQYSDKIGFPETMHGDFLATIAATVASGGILTTLRVTQVEKAEAETVLSDFLAPFHFQEPLISEIKNYARSFIRGAKELEKRGKVAKEDADVMKGYIFNSFIITMALTEEHFIPSLDEEFVAKYGLTNPKQARYIAEFLCLATMTFADEAGKDGEVN